MLFLAIQYRVQSHWICYAVLCPSYHLDSLSGLWLSSVAPTNQITLNQYLLVPLDIWIWPKKGWANGFTGCLCVVNRPPFSIPYQHLFPADQFPGYLEYLPTNLLLSYTNHIPFIPAQQLLDVRLTNLMRFMYLGRRFSIMMFWSSSIWVDYLRTVR